MKTILILHTKVLSGKCNEQSRMYCIVVLDSHCLEHPGAPLKKALLDAEIGSDVYGSYEAIASDILRCHCQGADPSRKEEFVSIIRRVLTEIVQERY